MLDFNDLANAQQVSYAWKQVIVNGRLWKKIFDKQVYGYNGKIRFVLLHIIPNICTSFS